MVGSTLDRPIDASSFQRLDNAAVVDFLTSAAGALNDLGVMTAKDTDNLRLLLSSISSDAVAREQPILLALERRDSDFLALLVARYGTMGFCHNLLRHTLRQPVGELQQALAAWGTSLLKRSELLFNRSIYLSAAGNCDRQGLFSSVIVDFSQTLADVCETLKELQTDLSTMNPHAMVAIQGDDAIDLAIAKACGFAHLQMRSLPGMAERSIKRRLAASIAVVAEEALSLAMQISANMQVDKEMPGKDAFSRDDYGMVATCEQLVAEAKRLELLDIPEAATLLHQEVRRRSFASTLANTTESIRQLAGITVEALAPEVLSLSAVRPGVYPLAARRRIAFDLIAAGVPSSKAWTATLELFRYLGEHRLEPQEVLQGELSKIDPILTTLSAKSMAALVDAANDKAFMNAAIPEKATTLNRAQHLAESFAKTLATMLPGLGVAILNWGLGLGLGLGLGGCGIKTKPQSDVPDLRPEIVFHAAAQPEPKPQKSPEESPEESPEDSQLTEPDASFIGPPKPGMPRGAAEPLPDATSQGRAGNGSPAPEDESKTSLHHGSNAPVDEPAKYEDNKYH